MRHPFLFALPLLALLGPAARADFIEGKVTAVKKDSFEVKDEDGTVHKITVTDDLRDGKIPVNRVRYRNHLRELKVGYEVQLYTTEKGGRHTCDRLEITIPPQPDYKIPKPERSEEPPGLWDPRGEQKAAPNQGNAPKKP